MNARRVSRRLLLSLAPGLVLTIAIAWLLALVSDVTKGTLHNLKPGDPTPSSIPIPSDWTLRTWHECRGPGLSYDLISECEWMGSKIASSPATAPNRTAQRITAGFPLPSMQWAPYADNAVPPRYQRWYMGLPVPGKRRLSTGSDRRLPLRPILTPFLIDLVTWTLVSYGLITASAALRARSRRRRGQCVHCAYPVTGLAACPECGTATQPVPAQT